MLRSSDERTLCALDSDRLGMLWYMGEDAFALDVFSAVWQERRAWSVHGHPKSALQQTVSPACQSTTWQQALNEAASAGSVAEPA